MTGPCLGISCSPEPLDRSEVRAGEGLRLRPWFLSQKAGFSGLSFFPEPEIPDQGDKKCKILSSPSESVFTANQDDSCKATMLKQSIRCVLIIC
uniref:Uncharacterized protein n=1 Tax=Aotus nancymaae TaxID=37293 RepID=A0A2K5CZH5_AOTNA